MPAPHHSVFYRPYAIPAAQPTTEAPFTYYYKYYNFTTTVDKSIMVFKQHHAQHVNSIPIYKCGELIFDVHKYSTFQSFFSADVLINQFCSSCFKKRHLGIYYLLS